MDSRDEVKKNALMTSGLYITFCPLFWHQISQNIHSVQDQHIHLLLSTSCCFLWPSPMPFFWMFGIIGWHLVKYHPTFLLRTICLTSTIWVQSWLLSQKLSFYLSDWSIYNKLYFILILQNLCASLTLFAIECCCKTQLQSFVCLIYKWTLWIGHQDATTTLVRPTFKSETPSFVSYLTKNQKCACVHSNTSSPIISHTIRDKVHKG